MKRSLKAVVPAALVLSLALAGCGDSGSSTDGAATGLSGTIKGAGASSKDAAEQAWIAKFGADNPNATISYSPDGSGAGREKLISGAVDYAGSDSAMDAEEFAAAKKTCTGDIIQFPVYVSPIGIGYNVEGVDNLQLSPATTADIFSHKIKKWNDPAIAKDNPDATLPDQNITTVNRSDESGTSKNFGAYLAEAAPKNWKHEPDDVWPIKGGEAAKGTAGVVNAIKNGKGTIGYADASQLGELKAAKVKVGNEYVEYSPEAAAKILEHSKREDAASKTNFAVKLDRSVKEAGVYPVVLLSYALTCSAPTDAEKGKLTKAYLEYVSSEAGQQVAAEQAGAAPLSETARGWATDALSQLKTD